MISRLRLFRSTDEMSRLSSKLEQWFQVDRAVLVGRAALGLLAVLSVWRSRRPKCGVAMSGAICHEVLLAVLAAGCEPIFCDVDIADGLVPDAEWARARTLGADVAIVAHLYGNPACMSRIRSIFPASDCLVVDDAAQALGSYSQDGLCGSLGDVGLLSFGRSKQISIGNGAILVRDLGFAAEIEAFLATIAAPRQDLTLKSQKEFRSNLDAAREQLIAAEDPDASGFAGLMNGMDWILNVPFNDALSESILVAIRDYSQDALARIEKARIWRCALDGTGMVPVGMGTGCVPWRYACRLPGIDWRMQAQLAEAIRKCGLDVSTWYLPANWFMGQRIGALPGVERLSREVLQFWLDVNVAPESIVDSARAIRRELVRFSQCGVDI